MKKEGKKAANHMPLGSSKPMTKQQMSIIQKGFTAQDRSQTTMLKNKLHEVFESCRMGLQGETRHDTKVVGVT